MGSVPQRISIINTYGASYIGAIITAVLYGLTTLQTYFYYVNYPKDRLRLKLLVYFMWLLDTLHMAVVTYCVYYYVVINYNNPPALAVGHWSLFISAGLCPVIAFVGRFYFLQKIYVLCPKKFKLAVISLIGLTIVAHLAFGVETIALLFIKKRLALLPEIRLIAFTPFILTAVLADIFIAVALCVLLWGKKTGFRGTNTIISKLIVYAINRCLLTLLVAIGGLIAFAVAPQTLWFLALSFIVAKLYANSLLAALNSRQSIRDISHFTANTVRLSQLEFQQSLPHHAAQLDQISGSQTNVSGNSSDGGLVRMYLKA